MRGYAVDAKGHHLQRRTPSATSTPRATHGLKRPLRQIAGEPSPPLRQRRLPSETPRNKNRRLRKGLDSSPPLAVSRFKSPAHHPIYLQFYTLRSDTVGVIPSSEKSPGTRQKGSYFPAPFFGKGKKSLLFASEKRFTPDRKSHNHFKINMLDASPSRPSTAGIASAK